MAVPVPAIRAKYGSQNRHFIPQITVVFNNFFFVVCRTRFMLAFELFQPFDTFPLQYLLRNLFDTSNKFNIIGLKGLDSFTFIV